MYESVEVMEFEVTNKCSPPLWSIMLNGGGLKPDRWGGLRKLEVTMVYRKKNQLHKKKKPGNGKKVKSQKRIKSFAQIYGASTNLFGTDDDPWV